MPICYAFLLLENRQPRKSLRKFFIPLSLFASALKYTKSELKRNKKGRWRKKSQTPLYSWLFLKLLEVPVPFITKHQSSRAK